MAIDICIFRNLLIGQVNLILIKDQNLLEILPTIQRLRSTCRSKVHHNMNLIRSFRTELGSSRPCSLLYTALKTIEGHHFGMICCAISSAVIFWIDQLVTILASSHYGTKRGFGTLQSGKCSKTKDLAARLHLDINVLSALLLGGGSKFPMQCLSSPTRKEVDRAQPQKKSL